MRLCFLLMLFPSLFHPFLFQGLSSLLTRSAAEWGSFFSKVSARNSGGTGGGWHHGFIAAGGLSDKRIANFEECCGIQTQTRRGGMLTMEAGVARWPEAKVWGANALEGDGRCLVLGGARRAVTRLAGGQARWCASRAARCSARTGSKAFRAMTSMQNGGPSWAAFSTGPCQCRLSGALWRRRTACGRARATGRARWPNARWHRGLAHPIFASQMAARRRILQGAGGERALVLGRALCLSRPGLAPAIPRKVKVRAILRMADLYQPTLIASIPPQAQCGSRPRLDKPPPTHMLPFS